MIEDRLYKMERDLQESLKGTEQIPVVNMVEVMRRYGIYCRMEDVDSFMKKFEDEFKNYKLVREKLSEFDGTKKSKRVSSTVVDQTASSDKKGDILSTALEASRDRINKSKVVKELEKGETPPNEEILEEIRSLEKIIDKCDIQK